MNLDLSRHAERRSRQRGVPHALLDALLANADVEAPAGSGCTVLRISRERLASAELRRSLGDACDRLGSLALIWSDATAEIVTVVHHKAGRAGRRYRRAH